MLTADQLCARVENAQSLYAALFLGIERVARLDPIADRDAIARLNAELAEVQSKAEAAMQSLSPKLDEWSKRRDQYPPDVNAFIAAFLDLLESGLKESLGVTEAREAGVAARRDQLRATLLALQEHRQGLSGYKTAGHKSPRVIDSKA